MGGYDEEKLVLCCHKTVLHESDGEVTLAYLTDEYHNLYVLPFPNGDIKPGDEVQIGLTYQEES